MARRAVPGVWIHILGAGWSPEDISTWREIGPDSIDSIAYYAAAQNGEAWGQLGADWRETALYNAQLAVRIASG